MSLLDGFSSALISAPVLRKEETFFVSPPPPPPLLSFSVDSSVSAFDLETYRTGSTFAPRIVCGSWAQASGTCGVADRIAIVAAARTLLESKDILAGANIAYDFACLAEESDTFLPLIFQVLDEGRVHDVLLVQALDAIYRGTLGLDPRTGSELRNEEGVITGRYSLWNVTGIVLDKWDAKENDAWRLSYALLDGISPNRWPAAARIYPADDARNTLAVALAQRDPDRGYQNLENLPAQVDFAFCIHLGAAHGLRTDGRRVEALAFAVEERRRQAIARYQKKGWIRADETEDQAAVKRSLAAAYGATGVCPRCGGLGKVRSRKSIPCRGRKIRGRYEGCLLETCLNCRGKKAIVIEGGESTCWASEGGCDGTCLDLSTAAMLARTEKGRIKADRDAKMESGDDDLHDYAVDEYNKIANTYVPYLRRGIEAPIYFKPNVLLKSGRMSYGVSDDDHSGEPIQQFPRKPLLDEQGQPILFEGFPLGVRECVVARPGHYLCSTDYASGELCTLGQYTKWVVGGSRMLEVINEMRDPGALHTMLGAQMLGVSFEEMKARVKAGDKQAKDFRQASKPANFGFPGGLGAATLVLTNRRKGAGSTRLPDGRELAGIRFCILIGGASQCGVEKIAEWKNHAYAPMCRSCVEIAEHVLKKAFFRTYPEVREYLNWVTRYTEKNGGTIPQYAWDAEKGACVVVRVRGGVSFCDAANQGFQGLLAEIFKRAYCILTRESYLGVRRDGTSSPLAGARFPLGLHDEPLGEFPISTASSAAFRTEDVMKQAARELAPDPHWEAKAALMEVWSKDAEPRYDEVGNLVVWRPRK